LIDTLFDRYPDYYTTSISYSMSCKEGFAHHYAWFEILSMKRCIHCGDEEKSL